MAAPRTSTPTAPARAAPPRLAEGALYERVAERVRERILAHTLSPGSWIDEQALTAELGISRTPLREALKVLASEGLVTMKLRRGAYVTEVSARDLYLMIAAMGYFYLSNRYTLAQIFKRDLMGAKALAERSRHNADMILNALRKQ